MIRLLEAEGLREKTLIVFAADHGEAFSERGVEGHARFVYRETTEVPFVLSFPFKLEPGVEIATRTQNVDIWPTVLDLLGLPPMEGVDGRSRRPEILAAVRGEPSPAQPGAPAIAHLDRMWGQRVENALPTVALQQGTFRYVWTDAGAGEVREELFDASTDPSELTNVLADHPDLAAHLRAAATSYLNESPPPPWGEEAPPLQLDEIELNQLRALGYSLP
jgi:arylsulfatase A-like enzyme